MRQPQVVQRTDLQRQRVGQRGHWQTRRPSLAASCACAQLLKSWLRLPATGLLCQRGHLVGHQLQRQVAVPPGPAGEQGRRAGKQRLAWQRVVAPHRPTPSCVPHKAPPQPAARSLAGVLYRAQEVVERVERAALLHKAHDLCGAMGERGALGWCAAVQQHPPAQLLLLIDIAPRRSPYRCSHRRCPRPHQPAWVSAARRWPPAPGTRPAGVARRAL